MLYFKVFKDFTNYVPIDETELEKALYAFKIGRPAIFSFGAMEKIESIIPDFCRSMGWNPTHRLDDDDWNDMHKKGIEQSLTARIGKAKERIEYLIAVGKPELIGTGADIGLPPANSLSATSSSLAAKFSIK